MVRRVQRGRVRFHPEPVPVQSLLPPGATPPGPPLEPTIAIVMPAFNEQDAVADSITSLLDRRLPGARSSRSWWSTTAPPTTRCARSSASRPASRRGAGDLLPGEPRQARRDGGGHPRHRRRRSSPSSTPTARSSRDALRRIVRGFADPQVGRDRRSCRRAELARVVDRAHAGGALLRRVSRLQGGRVDLRRGHVLLGLLLRLPPRRDRRRTSSAGSTSASSAAPAPTATTAR